MPDRSPAGPLEAELVIAPATWRDLGDIWRLERACFGRDSWPWVDVLAALTFPGAIRLRAILEGQAVGFVIGDRRGRDDLGWIASIGVHPAHRRRGIGRRLLLTCEQALTTRRIRLTLRPSNRAALEMYRKEGYREVDVWRRYYRDGEDGLVMEKELGR
jgi:ribosomal-protein-alanine N-acetyltransferase